MTQTRSDCAVGLTSKLERLTNENYQWRALSCICGTAQFSTISSHQESLSWQPG